MATKRERKMLFDTLHLLRKEFGSKFPDWRDGDDYIFAELDLTAEEVAALYAEFGDGDFVYIGSCIEGFAPIGLTYEEFLEFVDEKTVIVEDSKTKNIVLQALIPGHPPLLSLGDCPALTEFIGSSAKITVVGDDIRINVDDDCIYTVSREE